MELRAGAIVNLGIGMPEGVAAVAAEERINEFITLTAEPGVVGGVPASGLDFGAAVNTEAIVHQNQQFDFYDGGGLDLAFLGMAEADAPATSTSAASARSLRARAASSTSARTRARWCSPARLRPAASTCGSRTGSFASCRKGAPRNSTSACSRSPSRARSRRPQDKPVLYVTERCVFRLRPEGLELVEAAPGVDVDRDILAHMKFRPIVRDVRSMDPRIFRPEPMGLRERMLDLDLTDRLAYDPERNILFLNFEGLHVRRPEDVDGDPGGGCGAVCGRSGGGSPWS